MDERTRVIALSSVEFSSGFRHDLERIGTLCRERSIFFFVDGIQSVGVLDDDVKAFGVHALAADGHKWLLAPEGIAIFYLDEAKLDEVAVTVIDEADHMADLGFLPGVTRILAATPAGGQRMLFSATLDNGVDKLVKRFLRNELSHSVDSENSPVAAMTHHVFHVSGVDAKKHLVQMLASGTGRRILFLRTKHQARKLAKQLTEAGIPSVDLHGNLSQPARDRNLAAFSAGTARVLVATDIAARGVHVDDVELVVHCDPPTEHKAYLHRSGRTARAGRAGDVVTVVLPEQRKDTTALLRKAGINVAPQQVGADSEAVRQLVGEVAAYQKPVVTAVSQQAPARSTQSRRPRGGGAGNGGGGQRGAAPRAQRSGQQSRRGTDAPATHGRRRASRPAGISAR